MWGFTHGDIHFNITENRTQTGCKYTFYSTTLQRLVAFGQFESGGISYRSKHMPYECMMLADKIEMVYQLMMDERMGTETVGLDMLAFVSLFSIN